MARTTRCAQAPWANQRAGFTSEKVAATGLITAAVAVQAWKHLTRKSDRPSPTKYIMEDRTSENHDVMLSRELAAQVEVADRGSSSDLVTLQIWLSRGWQISEGHVAG